MPEPIRIGDSKFFRDLQRKADELLRPDPSDLREDVKPRPRPVDVMFPVYPGSETGLTRLEAIDQHKCVSCTTEGPVEFRDRESAKEYNITGMCQSCQDEFYDNAPPDYNY